MIGRIAHKIPTMNDAQFIAKLKELVCQSDWHHRYYTQRARKYKRYDYWLRTSLGILAAAGAVFAGTSKYRVVGAVVAGAAAFTVGTVLPNYRWEGIISGLKQEQEDWTRIFQGYDGVLGMSQILNRDEMLLKEFQKVEELRKAAELHDRNLPEDKALLAHLEAETRKYYELGA